MPSLILLPGLACDAELFTHQVCALREDGHAVHVSDVHTRADSIPAMAAALLAERPGAHVYIGHSMGGMLAMEVARQAPERVQGIALLGSSAHPDTPALIELRSKACELFAAGRLDDVLGANTLFAFHPQNVRDRDLIAAYTAMVRRAGAQQLIRQNRAVMARIDSRPSLAAWRWPALVAVGEGDGLTPPAQAEHMAQAIPGSRYAVLAGAGHMLTMEQPAAVTALLRGWLADFKPAV